LSISKGSLISATGPYRVVPLDPWPQPPNSAAAASRKRAAPLPPEKIRRAAGPAEIYGRRRRRIFLGALRR